MSRMQTINGEQFNVDAIQKIIGRAMRTYYPSERPMITVVNRLIAAYRNQAERDALHMRDLKGMIIDLEARIDNMSRVSQ